MLVWIFVAFAGIFLLERALPGWRLPKVRSWPVRVLSVNAAQLSIVLLAGFTWERWFQQGSIFAIGQSLPASAAGIGAYFIATFVFYWWHRWRHESDWLWQHFHQIHHSAQRLEVATSFYKHPLEMVVNSMIGAALVYGVLGLPLAAGGVYTLCTAIGEFFYHANWRTPHWIGCFFQRPEMHRIHHQYEYHRSNYGDIVWWDMLFGTYENPPQWQGRCGFLPQDEERLGAMLAFHDVHGGRKAT